MAIKSFGIGLTIDGTAILGLESVSPPSGEDVTYIDTTTHESANDTREFIGGLIDSGTLELSGKYLIGDAGQTAFRNGKGSTSAFVATFSDGSTATFSAVVGPYTVDNPLDEDVSFSASAKITGAVTFAAAAQ